MSKKENCLDRIEVKEQMAAYHREVYDMQIQIVANMFVKAQDEFESIPVQYVAKEIYAAILKAAKCMREIAISRFGGRPRGEAQMRYYEENMRKTVLKALEDDSFDILALVSDGDPDWRI